MARQLLRSLLISASLLAWAVAGADEPSDRACDEPVPLPDDERQQVTLSLLERYPELASSPGVKAAYASAPGCPHTSEGTSVIFYPHTDSRGIKEAFQALCGRTYPNKTWTCDDVSIRRYLRLASQDFEVRITADITSEAALALIEATRRDLQAVTDVADAPDTAIIIMPHHDLGITWSRTPDGVTVVGPPPEDRGDPKVVGYRVTWGTPEEYSRLTMLAVLTEGGDAANPDDWRASLYKSPAQQ